MELTILTGAELFDWLYPNQDEIRAAAAAGETISEIAAAYAGETNLDGEHGIIIEQAAAETVIALILEA